MIPSLTAAAVTTAGAADLAVRYNVEDKPLKAAVTGTGITPYPGACQTLNANPVGKVVSVSNHAGFIPTIPTATTTFLVNPVYVQLTTNQIVVASATAELGSSAGSSSFQYGICLQPFPAGPIGSLSGQPLGTATADTVKRPFPSSAAGAPGVGTWQIGFCVSTLGPALDTNVQVSGTVVVSQ